MTDETESGQAEGAVEEPTTTTSTQADDKQTSSFDVEALEGRLKEFISSTVTEATEKAWQSGKDKRIAKLQSSVSKKVDADEFETRLARLEELQANGMSRDDAMWRMRVEDALSLTDQRQEDDQDEASEEEPAGTRQPQASAVHSSIIKGLGLDPNNADVVKAIREAGNDIVSLTTQLSKLAVSQAQAQASPANEAQVLPTQASGGDTTTLESLQEELSGLQQKFDAESMKRRRELDKQIKALLPKQ
jgi:hypothetical protein